MRLHLETTNDSGCNYMVTKYKTPTKTLLVEDIVEKKNDNIMMIDIPSTLNYVEFDEVKDYKIAYAMWNKLKDIYGGDDNVRRAKEKSLRGKFK